MTPNTSSPSFLSLHPELRTEIYRHLLPNAAEISPIPHSQRLLYPDSHLPSLRTDDAHCHPSILCLNRQIDTEASQLLYARTFTLKFFLNIVTFLGHDYARDPLHAGEAERREEFLLRFPFAKVRKLRVQISTFDGPATFSRELRQDLYINLAQVVAVVNRAAQPLNRISIELAPCDFEFLERMVHYETPDPQHLVRMFEILRFRARGCEVKFPLRLRDSEELVRCVREFGRVVTGGEREPAVFEEDVEAWDSERRIIHLHRRRGTGRGGMDGEELGG